MKKIFTAVIAVAAALSLVSCNSKFEVENTATMELAGNWICTVFYSDGTDWYADAGVEIVTYNTSANTPDSIWINDYEAYWGTLCKVPCKVGKLSFGKEDEEFLDNYNEVNQKIWGGKITKNGAVAPGTGTKVDKIEFFIAFEDDSLDGSTPSPYCTNYYVVGYRRTGYPEDDDFFIEEWEDMPAAF